MIQKISKEEEESPEYGSTVPLDPDSDFVFEDYVGGPSQSSSKCRGEGEFCAN